MHNLVGIANHSPAQLHNWLQGDEDLPVRVLGFDKRLSKPTSRRCVILCPTLALFKANWEVLNGCEKATVFVFDTAVKCEYLRPMKVLDVEQKDNTFTYQFRQLSKREVRRVAETKEDIKVSRKVIDLIPALLSQTHDSLVARVLNFLYSISVSEDREKVKTMIFTLLSNNDVKGLLAKLKDCKRSKAGNKFIEYLESGNADNFAKALHEVRVSIKGKRAQRAADATAKLKAINYKRLARTYDVSKFDLQYSAKVLSRQVTT